MTSKDFSLGADQRKEILKTSTINSLNYYNRTKAATYTLFIHVTSQVQSLF